MRTLIAVSGVFAFVFFSCKQASKKDDPKQDTPKALQEKSTSELSLSKGSRNGNLVESLYQEEVEKTPELKDIEQIIEDLDDVKRDSLNSFIKFNEENTSYYSSADQFVLQVKDSALKQKIKILIDNSLAQFNSKTAPHNSLIASLYAKETNLNDLHTVLKLLRTLPLIEKYQTDNIPSTNPIKHSIEAFDKAIEKTGALTKK